MGMRQEIDRLSSALSVAEQSASDSQRLKEEIKRLEAQHVASLTNLRKQAASMQSGFAATERERDQLLQEVTFFDCRTSGRRKHWSQQKKALKHKGWFVGVSSISLQCR